MWKKITLAAMTAALLAGSLAGCGQTSDQITTTEDGKRTISIMTTNYSPAAASDDASENPIIAEVEEKLGVDIKLRFAASSNYGEKVTAAMAADTYPNIMKLPSKTAAIIQNFLHGTFWDITDKLKEKNEDGTYKFPNLAQSNEETLHNMSIDGRVYGVYSARSLGRNGVTIRKDWLKNIGYDHYPETLDEFYDVCKKFKYNDPDGNGVDDTFGMILTSLATPIQVITIWAGAPNTYGVKDGHLQPAFYFDEYMEGLKFVKKLNDEGLVNQSWATYDPERWNEMMISGQGGIIIDVCDRARRVQNNMPDAEIGVFGGVAPKAGEKKRVYPTIGYNGFFAFPKASVKNEEELDECLTLMDKFEDPDISDLMNKGIEGRHYEIVNGKYQKFKDENGKDITKYDKEFADLNQCLPLITGNTNLDVPFATKCAEEVDKVQKDNVNYTVANPAEPYVSNTAALMGTALDDIITEANTKFILGNIDEDGWRAAVEQWKVKGGEKVVAELDEAFQADDSVDHETGLPLEQENGEDAPASTTEPLVNKF